MKRILNKHLILTCFFFLIFTFIGLILSLHQTQGNFTYALDDPYIHLAITKHLVEQGIWSVDGHTNASASSSPLWVLILTPFCLVLGKDNLLFVPFILNLTFLLLSIFQTFKLFKEHTGSDLNYFFAIIIFLITPSVALVFGGMEHTLHIFLTIIFLNYALSFFKRPISTSIKRIIMLIAPFLVFTRYESIALILIFCIIALFYTKNWKFPLVTLILSLTFVVGFGLFSKYLLNTAFIPNSIVAKSLLGNSSGIFSTFLSIVKNFFRNFLHPHIAGIYILNVVILIKCIDCNDKTYFFTTLVFLLSLIVHLAFGKVGWLFRYEAYLVAFGIINSLLFFTQYFNMTKWNYLIIAIILPAFNGLILYSPYQAIVGTKNIYEQQIQMARFLKETCNYCSIAANDIGAITYFTNIKLLDLIGLANNEVLELRKKGQFTNEKIYNLLAQNNVEIIIIYEHWFENISFENYTKIGEWKIKKNVVCGGETVSFFSRNDVLANIYSKFKDFTTAKLPKTVFYRISTLDKTNR